MLCGTMRHYETLWYIMKKITKKHGFSKKSYVTLWNPMEHFGTLFKNNENQRFLCFEEIRHCNMGHYADDFFYVEMLQIDII